ncbi:MAG: glucose-6-phosphate isomerase [Anaerosomatales bacterium]
MDMITAHLGTLEPLVTDTLARIGAESVIERIWQRDHTVWSDSPQEIENRLGWLDLPDTMRTETERLREFAASARLDGLSAAVLLGMGGSSLAPEVFGKTFGVAEGFLNLSVLDSTHPDAVAALERRLDLARTLFIVSSKSGGTAETLSMFKYFWNRVAQTVGDDGAGRHFVAVTDPGTSLETLGRSLGFREVFQADPNLGGRYSALSHFGLVPASLIGVDLDRLLASATEAARASAEPSATGANAAATLGAALGACANAGRDKATFVTSPGLASFGDWVEQLIAESTGKDGRGILPVVGEPVGTPDLYGDDRVFIGLSLAGEDGDDAALDALAEAGHPVVRFELADVYGLGAQMFLWEMAVALAGHVTGIHPFDQPDVEAAKVLAREAIAAYREQGSLPAEEPTAVAGDVDILGIDEVSPAAAVADLLSAGQPGDYVSIQAFVPPDERTDAALAAVRVAIRGATRMATTVGYGPRFLHSTGQLHKGDSGRGLFIQMISDGAEDLAVPDDAGSPTSSLTFGVLTSAEASADRRVLLDRGRRVLGLRIRGDVASTIGRLTP